MSRRIAAAVLAVSLAGNSACLLTDRMGIEPAEATQGKEVKQVLAQAGEFVAMLTQYLFLSNGLSVNSATGSLARDIVAAGIVTPTSATIDDDAYYTNESVEACRSKIQFEGMLLVGAAVESFKASCTAPPDPDCLSSFQNSYNLGTLLGGRQFGELCALKKTGTVLHFGDAGQL